MLRPSFDIAPFEPVIDEKLGVVAAMVTASMREATQETKLGWREQVIAAGLGARLGNTIRAEVYPKSGNALNPAGYIWTKAPKIIGAFSRGATIRPVNGAKYLWIPTRNVPRRLGRGGRRKMSPEEVDSHFNSEFVFRPDKSGQLGAYVTVIRGRRAGYRQATRGRLAQGRKTELVKMFSLRRLVRLPKKIDLQVLADEGGRAFSVSAAARLGR